MLIRLSFGLLDPRAQDFGGQTCALCAGLLSVDEIRERHPVQHASSRGIVHLSQRKHCQRIISDQAKSLKSGTQNHLRVLHALSFAGMHRAASDSVTINSLHYVLLVGTDLLQILSTADSLPIQTQRPVTACNTVHDMHYWGISSPQQLGEPVPEEALLQRH